MPARSGSASASPSCRTGRPAGSRARRSAASPRSHTHLVVNLGERKATLVREGRVVLRAPVGIGRPGATTPTGSFYIRNKLSRFASPTYGPVAFGTSARSADAHRLAGGRVHRHPRHRPAGAAPGRGLPRVHPDAQRRHPAPREAHARRDARDGARVRRRLTAGLVLCLAAFAGVAAAQAVGAGPTSTTQGPTQLWEQFPLDPAPQQARAPARTTRTPAPAPAAAPAGGIDPLVWIIGGALLLGAPLVLLVGRMRHSPPAVAQTGSLVPLTPAFRREPEPEPLAILPPPEPEPEPNPSPRPPAPRRAAGDRLDLRDRLVPAGRAPGVRPAAARRPRHPRRSRALGELPLGRGRRSALDAARRPARARTSALAPPARRLDRGGARTDLVQPPPPAAGALSSRFGGRPSPASWRVA